MTNNELALIDPSELSLTPENSLNPKQLEVLLRKTPSQYVKKRPAKGGGQWEYVTGGYMKKLLNLSFGFDWDFEIISESVQFGEAIVKGKLTCRSNGKEIVKMQFGNKDIIYKKQTQAEIDAKAERIPLSIGNDLKAAATDCLKKCAAEIGFAADIYNKEDFREVKVDVVPVDLDEIKELFELKKESLSGDEQLHCERIIKEQDKNSYKKLLKLLKSK